MPSYFRFAALLAALSMLGPFSMDTYLPAFAGIGQALQASPAQMQQTISAYLLGSAFMMLFHGALSDSYGRRPVILIALFVYLLASIGCAIATSLPMLIACRAVQGMAVGAGFTVGRAIIRDVYDDVKAQQVLSLATLLFGILLYDQLGWRSIFWLLVALAAFVLAWANVQLAESHPKEKRIRFSLGSLFAGYQHIAGSLKFLVLVLASTIPFNGFFVYVLSAPVFLGESLKLAPTQFFWFFATVVCGLMSGSALSARFAGRVSPNQQAKLAYVLMLITTLANVAYTQLATPAVPWVFIPVAVYALGWSLVMPLVTIKVLDLFPARRGMASSLQGGIGSLSNALVAGVISPLVMHSPKLLTLAALGCAVIGMICWWLQAKLATPAQE
jgi:MFS transporter, DHA1 family, multidrug resistance protein